MIKIGSRILLVFALLLTLGAGTPTKYASLKLTKVGQELEDWCWAATATMAKNAVGPNVKQCAEASTSTLNCCPTPDEQTDHARWVACNRTGAPAFLKPHYEAKDSMQAGPPVLSWNDIKSEIDAKRPFVFLRKLTTGGGHFYVVQGYSRDQGVRSIQLIDPWPVGSGAVYWQPYSWYSKPNMHVRDQYEIKYLGEE